MQSPIGDICFPFGKQSVEFTRSKVVAFFRLRRIGIWNHRLTQGNGGSAKFDGTPLGNVFSNHCLICTIRCSG